MNKIFIGLFLCIMLGQAGAIEVTHHQYVQLYKQSQLNTDEWLSTSKFADNTILSSQHPQQRIVDIQFLLLQLADMQDPNDRDIDWVAHLTNSRLTLTTQNQDHPNQPIVLVDIGQLARNVQLQWLLNAKSATIHNQWLSGTFDWKFVLEKAEKLQVMAVVRWLNQLNPSQVDNVAEHFLQHANIQSLPNNQILAVLIQGSQSAELLEKLWSRPVDQYSYSTLRQLPEWEDSHLALHNTIQASHHKSMQSQALMSLAKNYSQFPLAQAAIIQALESKSTQWQAVMTLSVIQDSDFKETLIKRFKNSKTPLSNVALAQLSAKVAL